MNAYRRFAIYYAPDGALADFGAAWLGWDIRTGRPAPAPHLCRAVPGLRAITARPAKYGFHGTLKAPFRLAEGYQPADLLGALSEFLDRVPVVQTGPLEPVALGRFLALRPTGDLAELNTFAFEIVKHFERFRAPLNDRDIARRRASGLTKIQDDLMLKWGYPYVGPEFRFHMTLSGPIDGSDAESILRVVEAELAEYLERPFLLDRIVIAGEREDGRFEEVVI